MQYLRAPPQVDLLGVVTAAGPLGSIKRQRDNTEVPRRDITLADQRCARPLKASYVHVAGIS